MLLHKLLFGPYPSVLNTEVSLFQGVGIKVPLYTEVSSFQRVGIEEF